MNNLLQILPQFIQGAKQQHSNLDPRQIVINRLGQNCNSPQEALQLMLNNGRINQQQYEQGSKMLSKVQYENFKW